MLTQEIKNSLSRLSKDELQEIQAEVICLLHPLAQARERGKKYRQKSIQSAYSSQATTDLLKISDEDLAQLRRSNKIIFLDNGREED
jgi:hypothetical protein